jgi:hypothetical protein
MKSSTQPVSFSSLSKDFFKSLVVMLATPVISSKFSLGFKFSWILCLFLGAAYVGSELNSFAMNSVSFVTAKYQSAVAFLSTDLFIYTMLAFFVYMIVGRVFLFTNNSTKQETEASQVSKSDLQKSDEELAMF